MGVKEALALADRGFRVFPLSKNGKRPVKEGWTEYATKDKAEVAALFCRTWDREGNAHDLPYCQGYNVGILTDGMVVVDVDNKPGRCGWNDFMRLGPDLNTLTIETPSGGRHYFYETLGASFANTNDDPALGHGVDTRSYHGYVVGAGSEIDGVPYKIIYDPPSGIADAPTSLMKLMKLPKTKKRADIDFEFLDDPRCVALAAEAIRQLPGCDEGGQSQGAYNAACAMRDCGLSEDKATELLLELWNEKNSPPLTGEDMAARVANAYLYSKDVVGNRSALQNFAGVELKGFNAAPTNENAPPVDETGEALSQQGGSGQDTTGDDPLGNVPSLMNIQKRPWLVKGLLMCREAGLLGGAGSSGKTNLMLAIALHLAAGAKDVMGYENMVAGRPVKSMIYTAEDSMNELALRLHGACVQFGFDPADVLRHIAVVAGVENDKDKLQIARIGEHGNPVINQQSVDHFVSKVAMHDYGFIAVDPLINLHSLNENDASHAQFLGEFFNTLAMETGAAVMVTHHTTKGSDANVNSLRGSGALSASMRSALIWSRLTPEEAVAMGVPEKDAARITYIADGKQNNVEKSGKRRYFIMKSVSLWNGESVGVPVPYDMEVVKARAEDRIVDALHANMQRLGTATMSMRDAVAFVRDQDDMMGKMKTVDVEHNLRRALHGSDLLEWDGKLVCMAGTGQYSRGGPVAAAAPESPRGTPADIGIRPPVLRLV